jgi:hypothetical protein
MNTWVEFADQAAFLAFHNDACADNDIPHPGVNNGSDTVALAAQWTTAYVDPWDDNGVIKALVPSEDVATYGLTGTTVPLWVDANGNPMPNPPVPVTWSYHKSTVGPGAHGGPGGAASYWSFIHK